MSIGSVITKMVQAGVDPGLIGELTEALLAHEAEIRALIQPAPARTARQDRNRRYYEAQRLKASEIKTVQDASDASQTDQDASDHQDVEPRAHVVISPGQRADRTTSNTVVDSPPPVSSKPPEARSLLEPIDPVERLWRIGREDLLAMGVPDRQARSNIGRWMRDSRNDAGRVLAAIQRAREHGTADPIPLVGRLLNPLTSRDSHGPSDRTRAIAEAAARAAQT